MARLAHTQPAPPNDGVVAIIEEYRPSGRDLKDLIRLQRHGETVDLIPESGLVAGTKIYILRPEVVLHVRILLSNILYRVTRKPNAEFDEAAFTVPEDTVPGLTGNLLAWFQGVLRNTPDIDPPNTVAATRAFNRPCYNEAGKTDDPVPFDIPVLHADRPTMASGTRPFSFAWRGGAAPFTATLSSVATGQIITRVTNIRSACAARTAPLTLLPGQYVVAIQDGNGSSLVAQDLDVEPIAPAMPPELANAALPASAKELYFATYLTTVEHGRWTFEALQRIGSLDCHNEAVRSWLRRWGGVRNDCER
jgi:hypothetical protein